MSIFLEAKTDPGGAQFQGWEPEGDCSLTALMAFVLKATQIIFQSADFEFFRVPT